MTPTELDMKHTRFFCATRGAKITQSESDGLWIILDRADTPLYWARFLSEDHAALAFESYYRNIAEAAEGNEAQGS